MDDENRDISKSLMNSEYYIKGIIDIKSRNKFP